MKFLITALMCACAFIAFAEGEGASATAPQNLYWDGTMTTWSVGGGGWTNALGEAKTFNAGDNVFILLTKDITVNGAFEVGDIAVSNTVDKTIKGSEWTGIKSFKKYGSAKLYLSGDDNSFINDVWICGGTLIDSSNKSVGNMSLQKTSVFGDLTVPHNVYVGKGATLEFGSANSGVYNLAAAWQTPELKIIADGGKVTSYYFGQGKMITTLGPMVFRNGGKYEGGAGKVFFNGDIRVERGQDPIPSGITNGNEIKFNNVVLGAGGKKAITIYVDEVTAPVNDDGTIESDNEGVVSETNADFYMNSALHDSTESKYPANSSFIKDGPGTMWFYARINSVNPFYSTFTGDIEVRGGKLTLNGSGYQTGVIGEGYKSPIGNVMTNKTIFVHNGAVLCYGDDSSGSNPAFIKNNALSPLMTTIVSNGTLKVEEFNQLGNLKLYGTGKIEADKGFNFGGFASFAMDKSYAIASNLAENDSRVRLDSRTDCVAEEYVASVTTDENGVETTTYKTNYYGYTEFCVKKAKEKGDQFADVALASRYTANHGNGRKCGIKKTGDGILELRTKAEYSYLTTVAEGGLWITGSDKGFNGNSNVVVRAGGFVGGTATISKDLIIEEGGGFLIDATNQTAKLTVSGATTIPEKGILAIYNYTDRIEAASKTLNAIPLPLKNYTGDLSHINPGEWTVRLDGYPEKEWKNLKVTFDAAANTFGVKYSPSGFMLIVR